jgi:hypothetical protein
METRGLPRWISPVVAAILVAAMLVEARTRPAPADAIPFHEAAAAAIQRVPLNFGDWQGTTLPTPKSAQELLHPNASVCRAYHNSRSQINATLVIVQCSDARDMGGHYPPNCYPAQGWAQSGSPKRVSIKVGDKPIEMTRYEFHRSGFERDRITTVYCVFAVPGAGHPPDMDTIRSIAAGFVTRPFGAAQIQVLLDESVDPGDEAGVVEEILAPIADVIDLLADPVWRRK